jgi:hypothetical protein
LPSSCRFRAGGAHPKNNPTVATGSINAELTEDQLDNRIPKEDNEMTKGNHTNKDQGPAKKCGSGESAAGQQNTADQPDFDCSKMMEMMQKCCPDKMKDFSSMMSNFKGGCCSSDEEDNSEETK